MWSRARIVKIPQRSGSVKRAFAVAGLRPASRTCLATGTSGASSAGVDAAQAHQVASTTSRWTAGWAARAAARAGAQRLVGHNAPGASVPTTGRYQSSPAGVRSAGYGLATSSARERGSRMTSFSKARHVYSGHGATQNSAQSTGGRKSGANGSWTATIRTVVGMAMGM